MSFPDAVKSALTQYASFAGRARRSEYWWFTLFSLIVYVVATILDSAVRGAVVFLVIAVLALILPGLAVTVRRLHDTGRSGGWYFIGLIPIVGGLVLLVFTLQESDGPNQYGPTPNVEA